MLILQLFCHKLLSKGALINDVYNLVIKTFLLTFLVSSMEKSRRMTVRVYPIRYAVINISFVRATIHFAIV